MKTVMRNIAIATFVTSLAASSALIPAVASAATNDQVTEASKTGDANPALELSGNGFKVMRDVRAARVAIFNGDTKAAKKYVDDAVATMSDVKTESAKMTKGKDADPNLIPIDGQLVVADNFVSTPEKTAQIAKGNAALKKGDSKTAIEELKLAGVDIGFTRLLMPMKETTAHLNVANKMIGEEDFYEANMALKAAEDGMNVDTVMLIVQPGHAAKAAPATTAPKSDSNASSGG